MPAANSHRKRGKVTPCGLRIDGVVKAKCFFGLQVIACNILRSVEICIAFAIIGMYL